MTKKILKSVAKWIGIAFASMIGFAIIGFAILFFRPDLVLNEKTLNYVPNLAKRFDVELKWDQVDFGASKPSLSTHRIYWNIENLYFKTVLTPVFLNATKFSGQIELNWNLRAFPNIVHFGNFGQWQLTGGQLFVGPFPPSNEPSTFDINAFKIPKILEQAVIESASFSFDTVAFKTSKDSIEGPLSIRIRQEENSTHSGFGKILTLAVNESAQKDASWCINKEKCVQHVSANAGIGVKDGFVRIASIGPIKVKADRLNISIDRSEDTTPASPPPENNSGTSALPAFIADATLNAISTDITKSSVKLILSDGQWKFSGDLAIHAPKSEATKNHFLEDLQPTLSTRNFCIDTPYTAGCFQEIELGARLSKREAKPFLDSLSFQRISISANHLAILIPESSEPKTKRKTDPSPGEATTPGFDWRSIPFENRNSKNYHARVKNFAIIPTKNGRRSPSLAKGSASLELKQRSNALSQWDLIAKVRPVIAKNPLVKSNGKVEQPSLFERLYVASLNIRLKSNIKPLMGPYVGNMDANANFSTGEKLQLNFSGKQNDNNLISGNIKARADFPNNEAISLTLNGNQKNKGTLLLNGKINAKSKKGHLEPGIALAGFIDSKKSQLDLNGGIKLSPKTARVALPNFTETVICNETPPPGPNLDLDKITFSGCKLKLEYPNGFDHGVFDFACPLQLATVLTSPEAEAFKSSRSMSVDLSTKIHVEGGPESKLDGALAWRGGFELELLKHDFAFKEPWIDLAANVNTKFVVSQENPATNPSWETSAQLDVGIKQFSALVKMLEHLPYAVPAPFNVLDGSTTVSAKLTGNSAQDSINVPFTLATALKSEVQTFNTKADGQVSVTNLKAKNPASTLDIKLLLQEIALKLPNISLQEKFPLLFPDSRIEVNTCKDQPQNKGHEEESDSDFKYHIAVDTPKETPIKISTNLINEIVPISVDGLVLDQNGISGDVKINEFVFDVFRRKANVKFIGMTMDPDTDSPELSGNIEFKYTDITINLILHGTTEEPIITFESNPIRSEREILAILLYGQDATSFDDEQLQTADDLSAAFADQMVGLASLFMLAKTPIESVRYNPATKAFNAKVRLDANTSLNLGTTSEADQRIGVRHRLSSTWAIETDVSNDESTEAASGSALLEWSKRF